MKRKLILLSIISATSLIGCHRFEPKITDTVFVTFLSDDSTVLLHEEVRRGTAYTYNGPIPTKEATESTIYTFQGWEGYPEYYDGMIINENVTFYANFSDALRLFNVRFYNYDSTLLSQISVEYGGYASYQGKTPIKESNDEHFEYTFCGWDENLANYPIFEDTDFYAEYDVHEYVFATFLNYDSTLLERNRTVKGEVPVFVGETPTRPYDSEDKAYKFTGWGVALSRLYVDTTYIAQFELVNKYTVTFKNYDGSILQTVKVAEGDTAVYTGPTPTRQSSSSGDYHYTYTFNGWSSSLTNITSNKTITAQYRTTTTVTGQTAIRQHLDNYGSGSYHNVYTGSNTETQLGYSGSYFIMGYTLVDGSMATALAATFTYGSTSGTATFIITSNSTVTFNANLSIKTSNHNFYELTVTKVNTNSYGSSQTQNILTIAGSAASLAINNASSYLRYHSLDYIC